MGEFDIGRFVRLAGAVQTDDLDYAEAARVGLTDAEARILRYMSDTESHTILYLRDLLAGHSAHDPEVTAFLSVWVFEELWHGRALDAMLTAAGRPVPADTYKKVSLGVSLREPIEAALSHLAAYATPRFAATHMAWGAINELTAAAAYKALERRTRNKPLAKLLGRITKQERKHFAFYYSQAQRRLTDDWRAQAICNFTLRAAWTPVGSGVGLADNLEFVTAALFSDGDGKRALQEIDQTIAALPGLGWFNLVTRHTSRIRARYVHKHGSPANWWEPQQSATHVTGSVALPLSAGVLKRSGVDAPPLMT
jgi:hypothetical protein